MTIPANRRKRAAATTRRTADLRAPEHYLNRELSQVEFNRRVLEQARDPSTPLLDRLRFMCISASNLDEFFEVRVAALRDQLAIGQPMGPDHRTPRELLALIRERVLDLVESQYQCWEHELQPALAAEGICFLKRTDWNMQQRAWLLEYFEEQVLPVLSPLGLDPAHPFPRILNKSLNIAVQLRGRDAFGREGDLALIRAPRSLPRLIRLPQSISTSRHDFVFLAALLHEFVDNLFPGLEVRGTYQFRVTRDAELEVDEHEVENLAQALSGELYERHYARAVRLEIGESCPRELENLLSANFELDASDVYRVKGPVNLIRLLNVLDQIDRPDLKYTPFKPRLQTRLRDADLFEVVGRSDVLLHHPFEAFSPVVELLRQAAADPDVLAIKQTLYRTGRNSPLVLALIDAARAGKDVTVVVELRARFDEENNIELANRLQEAGVQVVYGVVGYKTHAKLLLIVRRERGKIRRYAHLGTGNYHPGTATVYTDLGLLTADREITEDVHKVFQQLSGLGPELKLRRLLHSPFTLKSGLIERIKREAEHARAGRPGRMIAKMNALNEADVILALYEASVAGVQIDLIVRGSCALKPGIPEVSANIRVRSIVGRFLEHSRVFYFRNDGEAEVWCASADWLDRNLNRRVEVSFPILDARLSHRVVEETLDAYLRDNTQAWDLNADGSYTRATPGEGEAPYAAQLDLLARLT